MTTNHTLMVLVFLGAFATGTGCNKLVESLSKAEGQSSASAPTASAGATPEEKEADQDGQTGEKLNQYVECLNGVSDGVRRSKGRYLDWVDEKKGPTNIGRAGEGLYQVNNAEACTKALGQAKTLQPPLPAFDPLVAEYESALGSVLPLIADAYKYYDQKNFKDDKLAKGKAMHAPLMAAFGKFLDASKALDEKVSKLNDELSERRLQRLSKVPNERLQYLVEKTRVDAKALVNAADVKTMKDIDLAKFTALVEGFEKSSGELETYSAAHKEEADKVTLLYRFRDTAKDFLTQSKELMRFKRDNKDFAKISSNTDGHPSQVMEKYNSFIQASNSLN